MIPVNCHLEIVKFSGLTLLDLANAAVEVFREFPEVASRFIVGGPQIRSERTLPNFVVKHGDGQMGVILLRRSETDLNWIINDGQMHLGLPSEHRSLAGYFQPGVISGERLDALLVRIVQLLKPDLTNLTVMSDDETAYLQQHGLTRKQTRVLLRGPFAAELYQGLPPLSWTTVFGPTYLAHFGQTLFDELSLVEVKERVEGQAFVKLTPSIHDVFADWQEFNRRREVTQQELGCDNFITPGATGRDGRPTFYPASSVPRRFQAENVAIEASESAHNQTSPTIESSVNESMKDETGDLIESLEKRAPTLEVRWINEMLEVIDENKSELLSFQDPVTAKLVADHLVRKGALMKT